MLTVGISNEIVKQVTEHDSAVAVGSGMVEVYATPAMAALMEETCMMSVQPELEEGCGTVGTALNVTHISATPIGMEVRCVSKLVEVDGRKLVFDIQVFDDIGLVGQGMHERFIVQNDKFMQKAQRKLKK